MQDLKTFSILLFLFLFYGTLSAQELKNGEDSVARVLTDDSLTSGKKGIINKIGNYLKSANKDKSFEKFDISFVGGPSYSVSTKFGIGLLASGLYRIDKTDSLLPPSDVSIYSNISTIGFVVVGIRNNTIFPHDKYRINSKLNFAFIPMKYYGMGYEAGREGKYTNFNEYRVHFKMDFLRQLIENMYVGATIEFQNIQGKRFKDKSMQPDQGLRNTKIGPGIILSYDTRDFIPNPSKGVLIKYEQDFYLKKLGSSKSFNTIELVGDAYWKIWKGGILAYDLTGEFNNGNVPWNMLSLLGNSNQMRGYYMGRYRDKKQINTQLELRQKIYGRNGIAIWGGTGTVFRSFKDWDGRHLLPSYGIGYRWEFKHRVNVRLDYGIGKGESGIVLNINEAF